MKILDDYNISFVIKNKYPVFQIKKDNMILSSFLMIWCDPYEIVNTLIPEINKGIKYGTDDRLKTDDGWTRFIIEEDDDYYDGIDAELCGLAWVTSDDTIIEASQLGDKDMTLPSADFKEIVIEWLAFILRNTELLPRYKSNE